MIELPKYVVIDEDSIHHIETRINKFVEGGYKTHTFLAIDKMKDGSDNEPYHEMTYVALMSLSSEKAYDNITALVDIDPPQVTQYLAKGWIVADSWSKIVRMVKKVKTE